jgi:glutamate decarboxylase
MVRVLSICIRGVKGKELTWEQEKEVEDLMTESFPKNFIDYEEYPQSADIQNRCVSMIGRLFNAPTDADGAAAVGTSTVGSSEAIMLAVLAMKKRWQNKRKAEGKDWHNPNIVMSSAVQVCWEKAARYFEVEEKYVYCTPERYVIDPEETVNLVDENTIGICVILGTTYTGEYEDAKAVNDLLIEKKIDTVIHIDAASGGFVAPFVAPELEWDFRLEKVVSINTSGHKYVSFPSLLSLERRKASTAVVPRGQAERHPVLSENTSKRFSLVYDASLARRVPLSWRPPFSLKQYIDTVLIGIGMDSSTQV